MHDRQDDRALRGLQKRLNELPGVRDVRIDGEQPESASVRVLVVPERTTEKTVRDVEAIAGALGMAIDPDRIQVLRTGAARTYPALERRRLGSLATSRSDGRFSARVALELADDVLVGESQTVRAGQSFEYRSVARATLDALRELLDFVVELEAVYLLPVGLDRYAVVIVTGDRGALVGSAAIRLDEHDAIARATLDALNRLIGRTV